MRSRRNGNVEFGEPVFCSEHVDQREQEGRIGLRADRHPFGGAGAGDRQMRLDMHALVAAYARIGMPERRRSRPAGDLDIGAERNDIAAVRRVGGDREGAVPELAVEMFGVGAFDALPRAETVVDRPPRREKGGERAHVIGGRAAVAEARGEARQAGFVDQAFGADRIEARGNDVERVVPRDRREARIFLAPFLRVGALHRREDAIGIVRLLHQAIGLDAGAAARRMHMLRVEIRLDLGRDAVLDLNFQEVRARHTIVTEGGKMLHILARAHRSLLTSARAAIPARSPRCRVSSSPALCDPERYFLIVVLIYRKYVYWSNKYI